MRRLSYALAAVMAIGTSQLAGTSQATAQDASQQHAAAGHTHQHSGNGDMSGSHGGSVQMVDGNKVETVLQEKGIMFAVMTSEGKAIDASQASGKLTLRVGDNPKEYSYTLKPLKNGMVGVGVDLSKVKGHMLHMNVQLSGVASSTLEFHAMGKVGEGAKLSDELLISLQGTCPVSGQKLGSMGKPPKVELGDKSLFVCCAGCIEKVKASPDQYLSKYYQSSGKEIRPGVYEATLADAEAIAKQEVCPVMDEPLGGMGTPGKVNVKGKAVFICCAGCAKKLAAEPDKYLAQLKEQGVTPPEFK